MTSLMPPLGDPLAPTMRAILRHPQFDAAAGRYVQDVIAWRRTLGRFNRVGTNLGFHIINYVMYLDFAHRAGANAYGATFSDLLEICERRGQCGARALRTVLALLTVLGHVRIEASDRDGRLRVYVPSDRLVREATDIYGHAMAVLDALVPGGDFAARLRTDPSFLWHIISKSGRAIVEDGVEVTEFLPALHIVMSQAGGLPTSISLADAQMRGAASPSTGEISRAFNLSQSQVRAVVQALSDAELIARDGSGAILDADALVKAHKALIARELALHVIYALDLQSHFLASQAQVLTKT